MAVNKKDPEPLWSLYDKLDKYDNNQDIVQSLDHYAERFSKKLLNFVYDKKSPNIFEAITNLSDLYCKQFDKKYISSENKKGGVNGKIINSIIDNYTSGFRQTRRRGGTHLVINQDMLLFITNLIIGNNGKMRFNELIDNFNSRGIYFDSQSKSKLLDFFQRIGNIEKKSDSEMQCMLIQQFERLLVNEFISWVGDNVISGSRLQFKLSSPESRKVIYDFFIEKCSEEICISNVHIPYIAYKDKNIIPLLHSESGDHGFNQDYLAFLRDELQKKITLRFLQ